MRTEMLVVYHFEMKLIKLVLMLFTKLLKWLFLYGLTIIVFFGDISFINSASNLSWTSVIFLCLLNAYLAIQILFSFILSKKGMKSITK